jgi:CheY-like chemotaxis protein
MLTLAAIFWNILIVSMFVGLISVGCLMISRRKSTQKTAPAPVQTPSKNACLENVKILIADDVAEIRELTRIILQKNGANVVCCANGQETLEKISHEKYDIILLDLNMPDMHGFEVARKIRLSLINKTVYVIALTASTLADLANKHIEAGFDDHLEKPVRPESLLRKIRLILLKNKQIESASMGQEITSNYTDDPDYQKTIERFINQLPAIVSEIKSDLETGHIGDISGKVHSLKGLGGMAGFPVISDKAGQIEKTIKSAQMDEQVDSLRKQVNELICLCQKTKINK